jgi:hypothetical protein
MSALHYSSETILHWAKLTIVTAQRIPVCDCEYGLCMRCDLNDNYLQIFNSRINIYKTIIRVCWYAADDVRSVGMHVIDKYLTEVIQFK